MAVPQREETLEEDVEDVLHLLGEGNDVHHTLERSALRNERRSEVAQHLEGHGLLASASPFLLRRAALGRDTELGGEPLKVVLVSDRSHVREHLLQKPIA